MSKDFPPTATNRLSEVLDRIDAYLEQREDVRDGSDRPLPNEEMTLLTDLRYARSEIEPTCSDAKEQEQGCFRALKAERELRELQSSLQSAARFSPEVLDRLLKEATEPQHWFPSSADPDSSPVCLVEPQLLEDMVRALKAIPSSVAEKCERCELKGDLLTDKENEIWNTRAALTRALQEIQALETTVATLSTRSASEAPKCLGTVCAQWRHFKPCCGKDGRTD